MKTFVIALSATFAFAPAALSAELAYKGPDSEAMAPSHAVPQAAESSSKASDAKPLGSQSEPVKTNPKNEKAIAADETGADPKKPGIKGKQQPKSTRQAARPAGYRHASWPSGHGATWRTGLNSYGFSGTFGACHYWGTASAKGYELERSC